jgi:Cu/Ag efflux protein CusF
MFRISVRYPYLWLLLFLAASTSGFAQDTAAAPAKQPLDHVLGAITAIDPAAHTVTVLEDKTSTSFIIQLADTKSFLKVEPGAKDLTNAQRITVDDLQVGDRVDARGRKADPVTLAARGLVLMSARDLQKAHQEQAAAWQKATAGTVAELDAASGKITVSARTAEGPKPVTVETSKTTEFTRYSPDSPKTPAPSQLAQIQTGDQIRVIGDKSDDGTTIKAQRVYSGAFRTLSATVTSIGPDGKSLIIKDLATKKPIQVSLNDDSAIRKLNPMMATMLARRFNPSYKPPDSAATPTGSPAGGAAPGAPGGGNPNWQRGGGGGQGAGPGGGGGGGGMRTGDISQMLDRAPKIAITELKPGDALVVSGVALGADNSKLLGTNLIAGVEPILQSAPQRQNSMASDWGLGEMSAPQ